MCVYILQLLKKAFFILFNQTKIPAHPHTYEILCTRWQNAGISMLKMNFRKTGNRKLDMLNAAMNAKAISTTAETPWQKMPQTRQAGRLRSPLVLKNSHLKSCYHAKNSVVKNWPSHTQWYTKKKKTLIKHCQDMTWKVWSSKNYWGNWRHSSSSWVKLRGQIYDDGDFHNLWQMPWLLQK